MLKKFIAIAVLYLIASQGNAQLSGDISIGTGRNQISFGQYANLFAELTYKPNDWRFSAAAGAIFSRARENSFDAMRFSVSKAFAIKKIPFEAGAFYQRSPYSSRINEHMAGLLLSRKFKRWHLDLGANTRVYQLKHQYAKENLYAERTLWEPVNIMYRITYHQPLSPEFELNASVTSFDNFIIQQETNPFLIVDLAYKVDEKSKLYFDMAYQQAGLLNIRVNYFGYYLRAGYLFDINLANKTKP